MSKCTVYLTQSPTTHISQRAALLHRKADINRRLPLKIDVVKQRSAGHAGNMHKSNGDYHCCIQYKLHTQGWIYCTFAAVNCLLLLSSNINNLFDLMQVMSCAHPSSQSRQTLLTKTPGLESLGWTKRLHTHCCAGKLIHSSHVRLVNCYGCMLCMLCYAKLCPVLKGSQLR